MSYAWTIADAKDVDRGEAEVSCFRWIWPEVLESVFSRHGVAWKCRRGILKYRYKISGTLRQIEGVKTAIGVLDRL